MAVRLRWAALLLALGLGCDSGTEAPKPAADTASTPPPAPPTPTGPRSKKVAPPETTPTKGLID